MFIFLTGMPGSGKTYWLQPLADALAFASLDLDTVIEESSGMSISEIFEQYGEAHFRNLERAALDKALQQKQKNWVIATGGGTPCFFDNLRRMKASGIVVYLKKDIGDLVSHLCENVQVRPLLNNDEKRAVILRALLTERERTYEQADLIIDAAKLTLPIFVSHLKPFLEP